MSSDTDISRRGFVATQVAGAAVVAALPATGASAATGLLDALAGRRRVLGMVHVLGCGGQTGDDGVDLAGLNEAHHDGAPFSDQRRVAKFLRLKLQIFNAAEAAAFAEQAKFIERRGAPGLYSQALGEHQ